MTSTPEISIIIPAYNNTKLLTQALDSVQNQTFEDTEVIVIDDGSKADFEPIINEYDDSVLLITHEENQGAATARNTGIKAARGEYIAFLDADDLWHPTKLEKQYAVFENNTENLGIVYTGFVQRTVDNDQKITRPSVSGDIYIQELERDRIHPTSTVMIRRQCIERIGDFDASLPSRQDYDLWIRITEHYTVAFVNEVLVEKREQPNSISKNFEHRIIGDLTVLSKVQKRIVYLNFLDRTRILSWHYHVIGRDYGRDANRSKSIMYFLKSIIHYPFRPITWVMLIMSILGADKDGKIVSLLRRLFDKFRA